MSSDQADFYTAATTQSKDQDKVDSDLDLAVSPQEDDAWRKAISEFKAVKRLPAEEQHLHKRRLELDDLERRALGLRPVHRNARQKRGRVGGPEPLWRGQEEGPEATYQSSTGIPGTETRDFAFTREPGSKSSEPGLTEQEKMRKAADWDFEKEQDECREALTATDSSCNTSFNRDGSTKPQTHNGDGSAQDNMDLYSKD